MSGSIEIGEKTFIADAAIAIDTLVKFESDGRVTTAGVAERPIGVALNAVDAAGEPVTVRMLNSQGTIKMKAAGAFAAAAAVYGRASGLIDDVSADSAVKVGIALEAASGAGSVVEVYPINPA